MLHLTRYLSALSAVVLFVVSVSHADTIGYWTFDDAAAPLTAGSLLTPTNSPVLDGTAASTGTDAAAPTFDLDRPGPRVVDGIAGPEVNSGNRSSLRFVNANLPLTSGQDGSVVRVPDNDPLLRPRDFTVEAFVKVDHDVDFCTIVGKSRVDANGATWLLDIHSSGNLRARFDSQALGLGNGNPGFNQNITTSVNLQDGQWHHVAMTYVDSTRMARLHVDYVDVGGGTVANPIVYDDNPLTIGAVVGRAFDGWIDEVRLTDSALTTAEFLRSITGPGTLAHWRFEDNTPPAAAATLASTVHTPTVDGAATVYGSGSLPTFSLPRPGVVIFDGTNGPVIGRNESALQFVNAGLPGSTTAKDGGLVNITDSDPLLRPRDFTAEAFILIDRHVDFAAIMGKNRAGGVSWTMDLGDNGRLRARVDSNPDGAFNQGFDTEVDLEDGRWHHVALTYDDNTRTLDLYVDYEDIGGGRTAAPIVYDSGLLRIGNEAGGRAFDGWIDEVRLSDHVLHPSEFLHATVPDTGTLFVIR